jgi:hypothetical protein
MLACRKPLGTVSFQRLVFRTDTKVRGYMEERAGLIALSLAWALYSKLRPELKTYRQRTKNALYERVTSQNTICCIMPRKSSLHDVRISALLKRLWKGCATCSPHFSGYSCSIAKCRLHKLIVEDNGAAAFIRSARIRYFIRSSPKYCA